MSEIQTITKTAGGIGQSERPPATASSIQLKTPRRILHFSDGTIEEYSTDDETDAPTKSTNHQNQIDIKHLNWGPWMVYKAQHTGTRVLAACDFVGEKVASFLGITTPKYEYEIEQWQRHQREKAEARKEETEVGGWMQATNDHQLKTSVNGAAVQYVITQEDLQKKY